MHDAGGSRIHSKAQHSAHSKQQKTAYLQPAHVMDAAMQRSQQIDVNASRGIALVSMPAGRPPGTPPTATAASAATAGSRAPPRPAPAGSCAAGRPTAGGLVLLTRLQPARLRPGRRRPSTPGDAGSTPAAAEHTLRMSPLCPASAGVRINAHPHFDRTAEEVHLRCLRPMTHDDRCINKVR